MADTVTSTTIFDGKKRLVMKFTNQSDGTGESSVVKVDKSTFTGLNGAEPSSLVVEKMEYELSGMQVVIKANHTSAITVAVLQHSGVLDWTDVGGIQTSGSGGTGDLEFTTLNHSAGDSYDITLYLRKKD
jgi:hypothetical protein